MNARPQKLPDTLRNIPVGTALRASRVREVLTNMVDDIAGNIKSKQKDGGIAVPPGVKVPRCRVAARRIPRLPASQGRSHAPQSLPVGFKFSYRHGRYLKLGRQWSVCNYPCL